MMTKSCTATIFFIVIIGIVVGSESYVDYGDNAAEKTSERLHELYNLLMQRNALDNAAVMSGIPIEHLMIRKSQRSPSLRLRFGRSGPLATAGVIPRSGIASVPYEDN